MAHYDKVMIDIESLDVTATSIIMSIGAVAFNRTEVATSHEHKFYAQININQGRSISHSTLAFWVDQIKKGNDIPLDGNFNLSSVLGDLSTWLSFINNEEIWANGISFDIACLEDAYKQNGLGVPWKYNAMRDSRTLTREFPEVQVPFRNSKSHQTLDDAIHQANHCVAVWSHIDRMRTCHATLMGNNVG